MQKTKRLNFLSSWNNKVFITALMLLISVIAGSSAYARQGGRVFYMLPQGEYLQWFNTGVSIRNTNERLNFDLRRFSEDNKRWFAITYTLVNMGPEVGQRLDYHINIYAEKDYMTTIMLHDLYADGVPEVRWLNDKLLYIEFWWRSTVGGYMIYDTDNEYVVLREMMFPGAAPQMPQHPRLTPGKGYQQ